MEHTHVIAVRLAVRVPVNASGDLVTAGRRIVERITAVHRVSDPQIRGLEPGLNDTTITLEADVEMVGDRGEDLAVVRRTLNDGVGVSVDALEERDDQRTSSRDSVAPEISL